MILLYTILGLLDRQELHGYRIKSAFEERFGSLWPLNFGQIYQTLKDLRRGGLVEGRFNRGTGHVGRWVYKITAKGRRALNTWLRRSPRPPQPIRNEMLIRLLAVDNEDVAAQLQQIAAQERVYLEFVTNLGAHRQAIGRTASGHQYLRGLAIDAVIFQAEAHLRWLAHCTSLIQALRPRHSSVPLVADANQATSTLQEAACTSAALTVPDACPLASDVPIRNNASGSIVTRSSRRQIPGRSPRRRNIAR